MIRLAHIGQLTSVTRGVDMAGNVTWTIDTRQMQAALLQYLERSKHSTAYVINKKLFFIAKRAYDATPVGNRQRILETFGVSQRERVVKKGKKAGTIRRITNYSALSRSAYAIMNWKRKKAGKPTISRIPAMMEARKMVASRLRAIGSLKSGWVGAVVRMRNFLRESFTAQVANRVKRPGGATPARAESNPVGEIVYRLVIKKKDGEKIDPRVTAALQRAFDEEAADTIRHLASELQKEADKVNVR